MSKYRLQLQSVGNPDHGEYYGVGVKSPSHTVEVESLKSASEIVRDYIDRWGLGGGNWTGGQVLLHGIIIAQVAYNGRVFDMRGEEITGEIEESEKTSK